MSAELISLFTATFVTFFVLIDSLGVAPMFATLTARGDAAYRARYSMPFFLHFRPDYVIETLPGCIDPQHPDDHPEAISSHDFLMQRLREINLA